MSVKAVSWSLHQDIRRSSNKFILLILAHLVRPHEECWETHASISYLVAATSLNRKTVVSAIDALRSQGILKATGKKAGVNKQIPVYEIDYKTAWPQIDVGQAKTWLHQHIKGLGEIDVNAVTATLQEHEDRHTNVPTDPPSEPASETALNPAAALEIMRAALRRDVKDQDALRKQVVASHITQTVSSRSPAVAPTLTTDSLAQVRSTSKNVSKVRSFPLQRPAIVGETSTTSDCPWNGSRLPETWQLPEHWQVWALQNRPGWDRAKVDRVASVFHAYCRGQTGAKATSDDWEGRWRLWVLRENDALVHRSRRVDDERWWRNEASMQAKALQLGIHSALPGERLEHFKDRIQRHLDQEIRLAGLPPHTVRWPVDNEWTNGWLALENPIYGGRPVPKTGPEPGPKTGHNRY